VETFADASRLRIDATPERHAVADRLSTSRGLKMRLIISVAQALAEVDPRVTDAPLGVCRGRRLCTNRSVYMEPRLGTLSPDRPCRDELRGFLLPRQSGTSALNAYYSSTREIKNSPAG
jgi:hypothetical protein